MKKKFAEFAWSVGSARKPKIVSLLLDLSSVGYVAYSTSEETLIYVGNKYFTVLMSYENVKKILQQYADEN